MRTWRVVARTEWLHRPRRRRFWVPGWWLLLLVPACGEEDLAPPSVVRGAYLVGETEIPLAVVDPDDFADRDQRAGLGRDLSVPTLGSIRLEFSELLHGDSVATLEVNAHSGAVEYIRGRAGIVRVSPEDGSLVSTQIDYDPAARALVTHVVVPGTAGGTTMEPQVLPAATVVFAHVMADRVQDKAGNLLAAATTRRGEPVRDADGKGIAATVAFMTEQVAVRSVSIPAYGQVDDPSTPVDESVAYDAPLRVQFNTTINAGSAAGLVTLRPTRGGNAIGTTVKGVAASELEATPDRTLAPSTQYELHIASCNPNAPSMCLSDIYGVALAAPAVFLFTTN